MEFGPQQEPIFTIAPADKEPPLPNYVAYKISSNDGRSIIIALPASVAVDDIRIFV